MSVPEDQWFLQEILQAMLEGGGDPSTFAGQQASSMLSELSSFMQQMDANGPAGALNRSIMGPSDGAEVAGILAGVPAEQRKALLATSLSLTLPPLHLACTYASLPAVEALLDAGAPLDAPAEMMAFSPLHVAASTCRPEVVELLLRRGANPLQLDSKGRTPLQYAVESKGEGALPDVPPDQRVAAMQRCTALLEAAEAAAAPELHRVKKSAAACDQCGKQEGLKKCSGCTLAWYCGEQCAKLAWRTHKQRCKVAQEMRRRLAVLADLSKPSEERWDAMQGIAGSAEAARLAGKLSALKLLEPVLCQDQPAGMGPPPMFPQYIPSVRAVNEVAWVAASQARAWDAPVPPLVQQFCALCLPERLLERVSKGDTPADTLERTLDVMSQLSQCKCAQALGRQLVASGTALGVARLLCKLPWGAAGGPSRGSLGYACDILGGMLEAERAAAPAQQQQQQQQQPATHMEAQILSNPALLDSCHKGMALAGGKLCTDMLVFLCSLFGRPATLAALLEQPELVAMRVKLIITLVNYLPSANQQPSTVPAAETTPAFISWLAFVAEQRPAFFKQLKSVLSGGQQLRHGAVAQLSSSLAQLARMLASHLASGQLSSSCDCVFMHVEGLQRKAASLLLAMVRDLDRELGSECRAALSAQQLRAAAAAVERRGGEGAGETADLLRQAAALL